MANSSESTENTADQADHPPFSLEEIAGRHNARVIKDLNEIDGCHASLKGLSLGLLEDITTGPELLADYCRRKAASLLDFSFEIDKGKMNSSPSLRSGSCGGNLDDPDNNGRIWLIPGYAASAGHIDTLVRHLGRMAKPHPAFKQRRLTTRVIEDAELLADSIIQNGIPVNLAGHSRGGLVVLCALQILQDRHMAGLIKQSVLLSPTSNGIRREISALARHLKIDAIGDLCPDSQATSFWQRLDPINRKKVQVVSQEGGDGFTSPEGSFVPGGTMFLTPHCGHQNAIRDPQTQYFQLTVDLVKHAVVFADQNSSQN